MVDKHEVLDMASLRRDQPAQAPDPLDAARARLRGKSFSQLNQGERDDLLMLIGCTMGFIVPEEPGH